MSAPHVPWPGGRRLRHVKQLFTGSHTAGRDCGPSSLLMALQAASGRDLRPRQPVQAAWIALLRSEMPHGMTWPATRLSDLHAAAVSGLASGIYLATGRRRPVAGTLTLTHSQAIERLAQGRSMVIAIDYGRLNDLMPRLSGSRTFRGGHAVLLQGLVRRDGVAWTRLGDPLHDGRRPGVPRGWQTVRIRRYLRAAETWGTPDVGKGRVAVLWLAPAGRL